MNFAIFALPISLAAAHATPATQGWEFVFRGDSVCDTDSPAIIINRQSTGLRLTSKGVRSVLDCSGICAIVIDAGGTFLKGELLIEIDSAGSRPRIAGTNRLDAVLTLDQAARKADCAIRLYRAGIRAAIGTGVRCATCNLIDHRKKSERAVLRSEGSDTCSLAAEGNYTLFCSKRGFEPLRYLIDCGYRDTSIGIVWEPIRRRKIALRSTLLPGWGQAYSGRVGWWWPVGVAVGGCVAGISALSSNRAREEFELYNSKYLYERNENARRRFDTLRRDALGNWKTSEYVMIGGGALAGALWVLNVIDAKVLAIGPSTDIAIHPRGGRISAEF